MNAGTLVIMKRNQWILGVLLLAALLAAGCQSSGRDQTEKQRLETAKADERGTDSQTEEKIEYDVTPVKVFQQAIRETKEITYGLNAAGASLQGMESGIELLSGNEYAQAAAAGEEDQEDASSEELQADAEEERELTEQELRKLQWSVRGTDNGFFVAQYYRPEEIDWQIVLQGGAGMGVTLSDEQVAVIRERLRTERVEEKLRKAELRGEDLYANLEDGEELPEEPFTEEELALNASQITALTQRSVQNYVKSRTGLDYSEMRKPLEWQALDRNLIYCIPGEITTMRVEFLSGTVCGNFYEIYYRKAGWAREKKAEYVMRVEIEKGKWHFISNLPVNQAEPTTLAQIDFYSSRELARLQEPVELIDVPELPVAEYDDEEITDSKKKVVKDPVYYWAVITAQQDDTQVAVERVYNGDVISQRMLEARSYVPGESIQTVTLQAGERVAVKVSLDDVPKLRVKVTSKGYFGVYAFGSENRLKRFTKEGTPLSTYVSGRNYAGEHLGPQYSSETELLKFLEGTWLFYDGQMGDYTATVTFSGKGQITLETIVDCYKMEIFGYDRLYTDSRSDPPDVIKIKTTDEETLEYFTKYYPSLLKKVGEYRVRAVQKDGVQLLFLSLENKGKDGLSFLLPGADPLADEIVLYRFIGAPEDEGADGKG